MLLSPSRIVARSATAASPGPFVRKVTVRRDLLSRDVVLVVGWILIVIKCVLASVAIRHWQIPVADFYIWFPSFTFAGLCTWLWLRRAER